MCHEEQADGDSDLERVNYGQGREKTGHDDCNYYFDCNLYWCELPIDRNCQLPGVPSKHLAVHSDHNTYYSRAFRLRW